MNNFHFGDNLRRIRLDKGISQEAMALSMDISQSSYSRYETQKEVPEDKIVRRLAEAMSVSPVILKPQIREIEASGPEFSCGLNLAGKIAYRVLLAFTTVEFIRGFWAGAEMMNDLAKSTVSVVVCLGVFAFWRYTEKSPTPSR